MLNQVKTELVKWAPPVAVILVGVAASELFTAGRGPFARVAGAMVGGVAAAVIGHKLGAI